MITIASLELIAELDHVVAAGSLERRGQILRRITSLFLSGAARLSEEHIELFDDVFIRLIDCIDAPTLAAFGAMLSKQTSGTRSVASPSMMTQRSLRRCCSNRRPLPKPISPKSREAAGKDISSPSPAARPSARS
jgi:hypothetical protein